MKLKVAAHSTAQWGFRTPVDTTVAIELAASWNPFMKSNASASRIRKSRIWRVIRSRPDWPCRWASLAGVRLAAGLHQAFSTMMPSMMLATSSHLSVTDSSNS